MITTQDYYSRTLTVWGMKLKLKIIMKTSVRIQKCSVLAIIQLSPNTMMIQTNYCYWRICWFKAVFILVDNSREHKKARSVNKNVVFVARISNSEYKNVLLSNKCLTLSMNRI